MAHLQTCDRQGPHTRTPCLSVNLICLLYSLSTYYLPNAREYRTREAALGRRWKLGA